MENAIELYRSSKMSGNIEKIISLMERDDSVDAPSDSIKWAKDIFRSRVAAKSPGIVRRLIAILAAEILPDSPVFGERSASASSERQLLYTASDIGIDLRIAKAGKRYKIRGQLVSSELPGLAAEFAGEGVKHVSGLDDIGGFAFDGVGSGEYSLTIGNGEIEITVPSIKI
jgi:hypothetical protein